MNIAGTAKGITMYASTIVVIRIAINYFLEKELHKLKTAL